MSPTAGSLWVCFTGGDLEMLDPWRLIHGHTVELPQELSDLKRSRLPLTFGVLDLAVLRAVV